MLPNKSNYFCPSCGKLLVRVPGGYGCDEEDFKKCAVRYNIAIFNEEGITTIYGKKVIEDLKNPKK